MIEELLSKEEESEDPDDDSLGSADDESQQEFARYALNGDASQRANVPCIVKL